MFYFYSELICWILMIQEEEGHLYFASGDSRLKWGRRGWGRFPRFASLQINNIGTQGNAWMCVYTHTAACVQLKLTTFWVLQLHLLLQPSQEEEILSVLALHNWSSHSFSSLVPLWAVALCVHEVPSASNAEHSSWPLCVYVVRSSVGKETPVHRCHVREHTYELY